jgi:flagellar biogenesis protein FliO
MTDLYLQMILALALVIGVILFIGAALKKTQSKDGLMKVLGYQSLGPKKGVAAVKVGKDVFILGVTPTDLKLFKTVTDTGNEGFSEQTPEKASTMSTGISNTLKRLKAMKDTLNAAK